MADRGHRLLSVEEIDNAPLIRSLARSHTRTALNVLVAVMRNTKATPPARVAAANAILDRGWGKPTQSLGNDDNAC